MLNIKNNKTNLYYSSGFSLVELMVAMLVGLIILSGVMSLYLTTRDTQGSSEDQLALLGDARFAIETLIFDLRHTGIWGATNETTSIYCHKDSGSLDYLPCPTGAAIPAAITGDCAAQEYINFHVPLSGENGTNPFAATCATKAYKAGTDILNLRYADPTPIDDAALGADTVYIRANHRNGAVFTGSTVPSINVYKWDTATNHRLVSRLYYVSDYTNAPGDGLPSLHRVSLSPGPAMIDDVLLPGVEDFQLEYGVDTDNDGQANIYMNSDKFNDDTDPVYNWSSGKVLAVKIWLLMRSQRTDRDNISAAQTFTIAGTTVTTADDGYRRMLVSGIAKLRNMERLDLRSVGGS